MKRNFKGVWIPSELYLDTSITWTQKIILIEVDSFSKNGLECFVSNEHLAKLIGISESGIEKSIRILCESGMLKRVVIKKAGGSHRTLKVTLTQLRVTPTLKSETHPHSTEGDTLTQLRTTITNTTLTNTTITKGKPSSKEEVVDYFISIGCILEEAEKFVDWYDSVGWKVKGGNLIKDWKAAARRWKTRSKQNNNGKQKGFSAGNFTPNTLNDYVTNG